MPGAACITGLFGYVLRRATAHALLASVFPLRHQVDVAVALRGWPAGTRFAAAPGAVLLTSPKSEVGKCDTDVQTLGARSERAHARFPEGMLRL